MSQLIFRDEKGVPLTNAEVDSNFRALQTDISDLNQNKVSKIFGKGLSDQNFSSNEKAKLAGVEANATANESDAYLLDRANHTGTQAISTVVNLQTELDSKVDKVTGYGLSEEDFTSTEKSKLAGLSNFPEAPVDGKLYGRKDAAWEEVQMAARPLAPSEFVYLSDSGDDVTGAGTSAAPFKSLKRLSEYLEQWDFRNIPESGVQVTISCEEPHDTTSVAFRGTHWLGISRLNLISAAGSAVYTIGSSSQAISITDAQDVVISGLAIQGKEFSVKRSRVQISGVFHLDYGVKLADRAYATFTDCEFYYGEIAGVLTVDEGSLCVIKSGNKLMSNFNVDQIYKCSLGGKIIADDGSVPGSGGISNNGFTVTGKAHVATFGATLIGLEDKPETSLAGTADNSCTVVGTVV